MNWRDRPANPQPWQMGDGCIIAALEPNGEPPLSEDFSYYGGSLVCESISDANQAVILIAIRQRDLLLEVIPTLPMVQQGAVRRLLARIEESIAPEAFAVKARAEMLRKMRWPYTLLALPEFASRARTEPEPPAWYPLRFVTDNIESDWARMGNGRCDHLWPWIPDMPSEECDIPF